MNKQKLELLKNKKGYHSFDHTDDDVLLNAKVVVENDEVVLLITYDEESQMYVLHYHVSSLTTLVAHLNRVKGNFILPFVKDEWVDHLKKHGLSEYVFWKDYRATTIGDEGVLLQSISLSDIPKASYISKACKALTRGFTGQSETWMKSWLNGTQAGIIHSKSIHSEILVEKENDELVGFVCVAIYHQTLWIREIVVKPSHQGLGFGKKLMQQAMTYGSMHHAKKAFLMADVLNAVGHHLYTQFGFVASNEGQRDMIKIQMENNLHHYLGQYVDVVIDRAMHTKHPKHDMIYPINYGYIPNTRSGDGFEIDAYVLGPNKPLKSFYGQVIAVIHRADDQEEKLVVADRMYFPDEIQKSVAFTEQYFNSTYQYLEVSMHIRSELSKDYEAIRNVNIKAFGRTGEADLIDLLRADKAFIPELSVVLEVDEEIIGHILLTELTLDTTTDFGLLALAPMAVHPDYQNKGYGAVLIRHVLNLATEMGYTGVIVLGHAEYYPKFGFEPASKFDIKCPFDVAEEVFMAMPLIEKGLDRFKGTVIYPKAFDEV